MIAAWAGSVKHGEAAETGEEIFADFCVACHTIGEGKLIGPDLAGVTSRRELAWLERQIKDPEALIAENDPIAVQLLREADDVPMPQLQLSDEQVAAVIDYLKSTEQQTRVTIGLPPQYVPTLAVSLIVLIGLTFIGFRVGKKKKVEVR
ncbi:MAG: cytochrome c [Alphaproteobacteria bacterium]|nr:cytochrome c [Alphaproteobacteria bacterium]